MKILKLTLKKKWFDMIKSGIKKQEYREIKPYWATRLLYKVPTPWGGFFWAGNDLFEKKDYSFKDWKSFTGGAPVFREFDAVQFKNGYSKTAPTVTVEFKGIEISQGREDWGAGPNVKYFTINLGDVIK